MNKIYAIFVSILLASGLNTLAMNGSPKNTARKNADSSQQSMADQIRNASIVGHHGNNYFDVVSFKSFITQHGMNIKADDLLTAYRQTLGAVSKSGEQESVMTIRDYTAVMIAFNKIKPDLFPQNVIDDNKTYVKAYFSQFTDQMPAHIAEHRFGECDCNMFATSNWPEIKKD